ncbi:TetR/AcrR family transcriptional regulator [Nocardioides sp.]|uniref:TetR/AcrR family transcriptional regulator n=1 Tax=Nocardioides sp. TaxID=35761 RepID=UPI003518D5D4
MSSQVSRSARAGLRARPAETLAKLLDAGLTELDAVGHEALTIRTVAARAGVSPATAYTYLASKNHLFAELFLAALGEPAPAATEDRPLADGVVGRVQVVTREMARRLAAAPALAAAVTPALLSSDPDVDRLRLRIGAEFVRRFEEALETPDPDVLETLVLAFSGALLQAGMGVITYPEMGERLDAVVATILRGHP